MALMFFWSIGILAATAGAAIAWLAVKASTWCHDAMRPSHAPVMALQPAARPAQAARRRGVGPVN